MPRNEDEESMNAPDPDPPCTPPKSTGNGGTGRVNPDGQEDIDRELFEFAREWMSKLRKIPCHVANETNVALWKQFREYPKQKGAILVRLFRCPLSQGPHRA